MELDTYDGARPLPRAGRLESRFHEHTGAFQPLISETADPNIPSHTAEHVYKNAVTTTPDLPVWLRTWTLWTFFVVFTGLWVCLLILWRLNLAENGFKLTVTDNRLAWKYGPTAVLVLVISLWKKVDYYCKLTQPWINMIKGFVPASRTLLLDYLDPIEEVSLGRALRGGDYRVAASIAGMRLLQVVVLFSTTLLTARCTEMSQSVPITFNTTFDGSQFWQILNSGENSNTTKFPDVFSVDGHLSDGAVNAYFGTLNSNERYPPGTLRGIAYQSFEPANSNGLSNVTATTQVFVPRISCDIAALQQVSSADVPDVAQEDASNEVALLLYTSNCPANMPPSLDGQRTNSTAFSIGAWANSSCGQSAAPASQCSTIVQGAGAIDCTQPRWMGDPAYAVTSRESSLIDHTSNITNATFWAINITSTPQDPRNKSTEYSYRFQEGAAFICNLDYSMEKLNMTNDLLNQEFSLPMAPLTDSRNYLPDLSQSEFVQILYGIVSTSGGALQAVTRTLDNSLVDEIAFNSNDSMRTALVESLNGISAQFMQRYFLVPADTQGAAMALYYEDRLHITTISLWVMVACLFVTSLLPLVIVFRDHHASVPVGAFSLARQAAILTASPVLSSLLRNTGHLGKNEFEHLLSIFNFRTSSPQGFVIECSSDGTEHIPDTSSHNQNGFPDGTKLMLSRGWSPTAVRGYTIIATLALPLAFIVAVEIAYRESEQSDGIATVSSHAQLTPLITLIPTLVTTLIAILFESFDFVAAVMAPFGSLLSSNQDLTINLLGRYPFMSLWTSLKSRNLGCSFSKIATLLGGLLTIVASDLLFFDVSLPQNSKITALQSTTWDWEWGNSSSSDNGAATTFDQIRLGSFAPSPYIWQSYVMPATSNVSVVDPRVQRQDTVEGPVQQNYTLTFPALEPKLYCEPISQDKMLLTYEDARPGHADRINVTSFASVPKHCAGGTNSSLVGVNWTTQWIGTDYEGWMGLLYNLYVGPGNNNSNDIADYLYDISGTYHRNLTSAPDNPAGCPSLGITFGYMQPYQNTNSTDLNNITSLICYQKVEQAQMTATFNGNPADMLLSRTHLPGVDSNTARNLTDGTNGFDSFSYRIQDHLNALTAADLDPTSARNYGDPIDRFFRRLIDPKSIYFNDPAYLVGAQNTQSLIRAVEGLYQKYMVNVIDLNFKSTPTSSPPSLSGTVTFEVTRLKVDFLSKLILQILLACMTVFGCLAYMLCHIRGVLPRNPCSIASSMALLAGSRICTREIIPVGAECLRDDVLRRMFAGRQYGLGWWERKIDEIGVGDSTGASSNAQWRFGIDIGRTRIENFNRRGSSNWLRRRKAP